MFAQNVAEFNEKVLKIAPRKPTMLKPEEFDISVKALREEVDEFVVSTTMGDYIGCVDAIIDLQYFAYGVLYKMGLTPEIISEIAQAVHDANMTKKLGVVAKRGDGSAADAIKPEGWVPPEVQIANILDKHECL